MIGRELFEGKNVRLSAIDPERDAEVEAQWTQDLGYVRFNFSERIPRPINFFQMKKIYDELGKESSDLKNHLEFAVRTLKNDMLIGCVRITSIEWTNGCGSLQIGLRDIQTHSKYGREVLELVLGYAFREINLHTLYTVLPACEEWLVQFYEQNGFVFDVRQRKAYYADGEYSDKCYLSILQDEWISMKDKEMGQ